MNELLRSHANTIVAGAISQVQPHEAVRRVLENRRFDAGRLILVAVGKAAWSMAQPASEYHGSRIDGGIVITKHG